MRMAGSSRAAPAIPAAVRQAAHNKATGSAEPLLDGETEALTRMALELALGANATALRLCLERIILPHRGRTVQIGLSPVRSFHFDQLQRFAAGALDQDGAGVAERVSLFEESHALAAELLDPCVEVGDAQRNVILQLSA